MTRKGGASAWQFLKTSHRGTYAELETVKAKKQKMRAFFESMALHSSGMRRQASHLESRLKGKRKGSWAATSSRPKDSSVRLSDNLTALTRSLSTRRALNTATSRSNPSYDKRCN